MKLEVGKYYKNANGERVGPVMFWGCIDGENLFHYESSDGAFNISGVSSYGRDPDIISEWTEEQLECKPVNERLELLNEIQGVLAKHGHSIGGFSTTEYGMKLEVIFD